MPQPYKRRTRRRERLRDRFRRKPVEESTPIYDFTGEEDTTDRQSRLDNRRKTRREYVIDRKEAQAGIAKHRKWVMLWIAVIVVAIVVLAIFVMNKMSLTGILF